MGGSFEFLPVLLKGNLIKVEIKTRKPGFKRDLAKRFAYQ